MSSNISIVTNPFDLAALLSTPEYLGMEDEKVNFGATKVLLKQVMDNNPARSPLHSFALYLYRLLRTDKSGQNKTGIIPTRLVLNEYNLARSSTHLNKNIHSTSMLNDPLIPTVKGKALHRKTPVAHTNPRRKTPVTHTTLLPPPPLYNLCNVLREHFSVGVIILFCMCIYCAIKYI